jgi:hypothetical protein
MLGMLRCGSVSGARQSICQIYLTRGLATATTSAAFLPHLEQVITRGHS